MNRDLVFFMTSRDSDAQLAHLATAARVRRGRYQQLIVVVAAEPRDKEKFQARELKRLAGLGMAGKHVRLYVPDELRKTPNARDIESYLRAPFLTPIMNERVAAFVPNPEWPDAVLAMACLTVSTKQAEWFSGEFAAEFPAPPADYRLRDLFVESAKGHPELAPLVGSSAAMKQLRTTLESAAKWPQPKLLVGETGTGKELCARALHDLSGRPGRFLPVNCALLDPERAESTLFGHVKGAFTGADKDRTGRIREASNGTLFLDEALSMPQSVQAKLLRATNEIELASLRVVPMGADESDGKTHSVRVTAAIQPPKESEKLRSDLYHRLAWFRIEIPPLRERGADAFEIGNRLAATFAEHLPADVDGPRGFSPDAKKALRSPGFYSWPGNVRELRRVVFRAFHRACHHGNGAIELADIEDHIERSDVDVLRTSDLRASLARMGIATAERALVRSASNKSEAARSLGFAKGSALLDWLDRQRKALAKRSS